MATIEKGALTLADAIVAQERTVERLTTRLLRYTDQIERTLATVKRAAEVGDLGRVNDLGELQSLATGYEAACGALSQAHEALGLMRQAAADA